MKIFRFSNSPSMLDNCWQKSIASNCDLPCFNEDIAYILNELGREKKHWVFGFTKSQFVKACKTFKKQAKFACDKSILKWSDQSKLKVFEIDEKDVFVFSERMHSKI